jgi:hypothetical protein
MVWDKKRVTPMSIWGYLSRQVNIVFSEEYKRPSSGCIIDLKAGFCLKGETEEMKHQGSINSVNQQAIDAFQINSGLPPFHQPPTLDIEFHRKYD